eukprot:12413217-Karenia_brevis.AAC.1
MSSTSGDVSARRTRSRSPQYLNRLTSTLGPKDNNIHITSLHENSDSIFPCAPRAQLTPPSTCPCGVGDATEAAPVRVKGAASCPPKVLSLNKGGAPVQSLGAPSRYPPIADPWDIKYQDYVAAGVADEYDVLLQRDRLVKTTRSSAIQHWSPNCGTCTRARERPIPGAKSAPVPVRSTEYPKGLPFLSDHRWAKMKTRVDDDTAMILLAINECTVAHRDKRLFTLEHPGNSLARNFPEWQALEKLPGVFIIEFHSCMFEPSDRRKYEIVVTNIPELKPHISKSCRDAKVCSRTGEPHRQWNAKVEDGRVVEFGTSGSAEFPAGLCRALADGYIEALKSRTTSEDYLFIEVFCGLRAPLTDAVRRRIVDVAGVSQLPRPQETRHQMESRAAGWQPKWKPDNQLISDGICNPIEHIKLANALCHPALCNDFEDAEWRPALDKIVDGSNSLEKERLRAVARARQLAKELDQERLRLISSTAGAPFKEMRSPLHIPLMMELGKVAHIPDSTLPSKLLLGLPIVGPADRCPRFADYHVEAKMSIEEFLSSAPARRAALIDKTKKEALVTDKAILLAVYEKTMQEVAAGTMGPDLTEHGVLRKYGPLWNACQRFGIQQGWNDDGSPKFRCIDNEATSGCNEASE